MATPGTHLRRVARVNANHTAPPRFGLVLKETAQLRKCPRVQPATGFPSGLLGSGADVVQVLNHNHGASGRRVDDSPTEHMIAVAAEAVNLPGQTAQTPLDRASAFRLKRTLQSEIATVNLLPATGAVELGVGRDGRAVQPHVNADRLPGWGDRNIGKRDNEMEQKPTLAVHQVRTVKPVGLRQYTTGVRVWQKRNGLSAGNGGEADNARVRAESICPGIVSNGHEGSVGTGRLSPLLLSVEGRPDGFCRLHARCNHQLGRQIRKRIPQVSIRGVMQTNAVLFDARPTVCADSIKTRGGLLKRVS